MLKGYLALRCFVWVRAINCSSPTKRGRRYSWGLCPQPPGVYCFLDYRMGRGHRPVKVIIPHISQHVIHDRHDSPDILVSYVYPHNIAKRQDSFICIIALDFYYSIESFNIFRVLPHKFPAYSYPPLSITLHYPPPVAPR